MPTEAKLKAVQDWPTPNDIKDVWSFSGFVNYYQQFVKDFVAIMDPLTSLTKKDVMSLMKRLSEVEGIIMCYASTTIPKA